MAEMVPAGPVQQHLKELRQRLTIKEISRQTGVGRFQIEAFQRPTRTEIRADEAAAILAATPDPGWVRLSDLPRFSGVKLRRVREAAGFSMGSLEDAAGLSRGLVHHWEGGRHKPQLERLENVMRVLECTFDDISGPEQPVEPEMAGVEEYLRPARRYDDEIMVPYPCLVCGETFRSRRSLSSHPHRTRKEEPVDAAS
jgi:transcriptional regulator with XRE-family HTH domain